MAAVIVDTLSLGSISALVAVGFVVLFRSTRVLSFAQGAFMVVGALVFKSLIDQGWPLLAALAGAVAAAFLVGAVTYRVFFARLIGSEPFITAVATIGLGTLYGAVLVLIWGPEEITLPSDLISTRPWPVGPFVFNEASVFGIAVAAAAFLVLLIIFQHTRMGLRMRAVADSAMLAGQHDVRTVGVSMIAWGIA